MFKTKQDTQDRYQKLIAQKQDIEFDPNGGHPESKRLIKVWKENTALAYDEQMRRRAEWDTYYENVKESPIYELFQEQRAAAGKGDWGKVKDLAAQAKLMKENGHNITLTKPIHIDQFDLDNNTWIKSYKRIDLELKTLTNYPTDDEARKVFGE